MVSPFLAKLEHGAILREEDREKLRDLTRNTRKVEARQDIIPEGDQPSVVNLVMSGFACRYKTLSAGRRRIVAVLLPGDFCDLHVTILGAMDHSIGTLSACTMVEISRQTIKDLTDAYPRITKALWWSSLVDEAILRQWLVNMSGKGADRQMAHFFCELLLRLQVTGHATANSFAFPLTQTEIGDMLGISAVHVNRSLQQLRARGLIVVRDRLVKIPDVNELRKFAEFDPAYLHLRHEGVIYSLMSNNPISHASLQNAPSAQEPHRAG